MQEVGEACLRAKFLHLLFLLRVLGPSSAGARVVQLFSRASSLGVSCLRIFRMGIRLMQHAG